LALFCIAFSTVDIQPGKAVFQETGFTQIRVVAKGEFPDIFITLTFCFCL
jgi:hypothetical protein